MFGFEDRTRALLAAVWRLGNVSRAAESVGMDPANARRHLRTAERRVGERLVVARRGGSDGRNATLTPAGRRALALSALRGVSLGYVEADGLTPVRVGRRTLYVAGAHAPGPVELRIPPESVAISRGAIEGSPRNEIPARVTSVRRDGEGTYRVGLRAGALALDALVVRAAVRELRLRAGSRVRAVVKAVAIDVARGG